MGLTVQPLASKLTLQQPQRSVTGTSPVTISGISGLSSMTGAPMIEANGMTGSNVVPTGTAAAAGTAASNYYAGTTGPTQEQVAAQNAAAAQEAAINSQIANSDAGYDRLANRVTEGFGIVNQKEADSNAATYKQRDHNTTQVNEGYALGDKNLTNASNRVGEYETDSMKQLENNLRSAFDSFRMRLGAVGAGDSSAMEAGSRALSGANSKQRGEIKKDSKRQHDDIGGKREALELDKKQKQDDINFWVETTLKSIIDTFTDRRRSLTQEGEDIQWDKGQSQQAIRGGGQGGASRSVDAEAILQAVTGGYTPEMKNIGLDGANYNYNATQMAVGKGSSLPVINGVQSGSAPTARRREDD